MKIIDIDWRVYRVPFRHSFTTAHGALAAREGMLVQVTTEQGISGLGEIAPLPAFGGASLADVMALLPALAARLREKTLDEALELVLAASYIGAHATMPASAALASTRCGLESALLDALGKTRGCTVCQLLAPVGTTPRAAIAVNAVIGAGATSAAITAAREASRHGVGCVKLKVGLGGSIQQELERVAAVRDAIGPTMHLRLDANEAWTLEEAIAILSRCVPYVIQYVEQPLQARDLAGARTLRQAVPIPIAADEAVQSPESARLVLENEAADILVIKPQLAGGLHAGQQIMQAAAQRGVQCVVTSTLETGVGVAGALHLAAASPALTLACGLATLDLLMDDLILNDLAIREGLLSVPAGAGLGIALDQEALQRYCLRGID